MTTKSGNPSGIGGPPARRGWVGQGYAVRSRSRSGCRLPCAAVELRRYVAILRRRWPIVVVAVVLAGVLGYATRSTGVTYRASTTIYVGNRQFGSGGAGDLTNAESGAGVERV